MRPAIGVFRQQAGITLGDMKDDGTCLEQGQIALLIGGDLPERMKRQMRRFLHRLEGHKPHRVRLPDFFKRPTNAGIARRDLSAGDQPINCSSAVIWSASAAGLSQRMRLMRGKRNA